MPGVRLEGWLRVSTCAVFRALADPTRQRILELLAERDMAAGEIAAAFRLTAPSISHHLSVLRQAGLVRQRRAGQQVIYALDRAALAACWTGFFARILGSVPRYELPGGGRATGRQEGDGEQ